MYTDKHFPPTFLSKNPSLRDMVKDQTDYDRRIDDISSNFKKETDRSTHQTSIKNKNDSDRTSSHFSRMSFAINEPVKRRNSKGSIIYPVDHRIGEERAIRASQRRNMRHTPTRQLETNLTLRPNTPNILLSTSFDDRSGEESSHTSQVLFPRLSYGRVTPSRDLFPPVTDTNNYRNFSFQRPSEYYRNSAHGQYASETNDRFFNLRQRANTPTSFSRNYGNSNFSNYKVPSANKYDFLSSSEETPRSTSSFHRSNSNLAPPSFRSVTPKPTISRETNIENVSKASSYDIQAKAVAKRDSDSYYTDKYYSKEFLSNSKPLSEMIKK